MKIKSLTIYCSSSNLLSQDYYDLSNKIGDFLAKKRIKIIYGGGKVGMMGKISKSAINSGGKVIGIIPEFLNSREIIDYDITETKIVKNMSKRKQLLFELGDAFLVLPGGSGTIEEASEVISWKLLGLHKKNIILFNYQNYWNSFIKMYDNAKKEYFGKKNLNNICLNVNSFKEFTKLF